MADDKKNIRGDFSAGYKRVSSDDDTMEFPKQHPAAPKKSQPQQKKPPRSAKAPQQKQRQSNPPAVKKKPPTRQPAHPAVGTVQMSSAERRRAHAEMRRRQARRKQLLSYFLLGAVAIGVTVILSLTVFFKVTEITVEGELSKYTSDAIIAECGIKSGDNLFMCDADGCESGLPECLPYVESVKVKRKLPDKIILVVQEDVAAYSFLTKGQAVMMSSSGKVLEVAAAEAAVEATVVVGTAPILVEPGKPAEFEDTATFDLLKKIGSAVEKAGILSITSCDISDTTYLKLSYQGRITLLLGNSSGLDKKLLLAAKVIEKENEIDVNQLGQIDLTIDGKAYFRPLKSNASEDEFASPEEETTKAET